jgi:hypothetical protein
MEPEHPRACGPFHGDSTQGHVGWGDQSAAGCWRGRESQREAARRAARGWWRPGVGA